MSSVVIGASLSEPHIDEFAVEFVYIIHHAISQFRLIFCKFLCHSLFQNLFTNYSTRRHKPPYLLDGDSKDKDHLWTYLFND